MHKDKDLYVSKACTNSQIVIDEIEK
jgi:hypothetical protein